MQCVYTYTTMIHANGANEKIKGFQKFFIVQTPNLLCRFFKLNIYRLIFYLLSIYYHISGILAGHTLISRPH
jgi:hypothetical protein